MQTNASEFLMLFFSTLAGRIPGLIVYVAALVVAAFLWRRAPRAALFCVLGFGLLLILAVAMPALQAWIQISLRAAGMQRLGVALSAMALGSSVLSAVGHGLLLAAIFVGRQPAATPPGTLKAVADSCVGRAG